MNEDVFNTAIRKFLKEVGVTSQREIEKAVRDAVASGKLKGSRNAARQSDADARHCRADACGRGRIKLGKARISPFYFSSSGAISLGRNSAISGQMHSAMSTRIIGTSMISVSFSA